MKIQVVCLACSKVFEGYSGHKRKYCSSACFYKNRLGRKEVKGWSNHHDKCLGCGLIDQPYQAKGYCRRCYNQLPEIKKLKDLWSMNNRQRLYEKNQKYRATINGRAVNSNYLSRRRLHIKRHESDITTEFLRELWVKTTHCELCLVEMEINGKYPNGKQLDHITLLSHGGLHIRSNVRYICARCNITRGRRVASSSKDST